LPGRGVVAFGVLTLSVSLPLTFGVPSFGREPSLIVSFLGFSGTLVGVGAALWANVGLDATGAGVAGTAADGGGGGGNGFGFDFPVGNGVKAL
jgi:hypothetical protein